MNSLLTRVSGGLIALALVASATGAARADVHLEGTLSHVDPARTDTGQAVYDMTPDRATLSVAVQNVFRADTVDVFVNGDFIGTIALDVSGEFVSGELDLDTTNGDDVPTLQDGDEIEVFDGQLLILAGNVSSAVHLEGTLFPFDPTRPDTGQVVYDMTPDRTTLSVAVKVIRASTVDVFVNGDFIGTIALDPTTNRGELDLDTANGDDVPTLQDGDEIEVFDGASPVLHGNVHSAG
jgi:hypothetical protein